MIINYGLKRRLRQILYGLKRSFGGTIHIYTLMNAEVNYSTGIKTSTQIVTKIIRAIVLPIKIERNLVQSTSSLMGTKISSFNSMYDVGTRLFVIDAQDVNTNFEIDLDDWIVYNSKKYNLKSIDKLELNSGWLIVGKEIEQSTGVLPQQEILHDLILEDSIEEVLS